MRVARVALDVPVDTLFDYRVPESMDVGVGARVSVPFGGKSLVGVVLELASSSAVPARKLRSVARAFVDDAVLSPADLGLLRFCSRYYHHPIGAVVATGLPSGLRRAAPARVALRRSYRLTAAGAAVGIADLPRRRLVQRRLLAQLQQQGALDEDRARAISPRATAALAELAAAGWVEAVPELPAAGAGEPAMHCAPARLTSEQEHAVNDICGALDRYRTCLLHGITGSGKTEVYLQAIARTLERGGQVLVLVPEINLTPQLEDLFHNRFPGALLAPQHSGLSDGERLRHWLLAAAGRAHIVLGTRSAVFTPLPRLKLVVVDEEHDPSFKQQDGLRYSARDLAIFRARQQAVPVVLSSASPSLETYHNARRGRYRWLRLTQRAAQDAALPEVILIDMRSQPPDRLLSPQLAGALERNLAGGEQSLVFLNRRGYAPVLMCFSCGWVSPCQRCEAKLVLHLKERRLRCHHCGSVQHIPANCPACGNQDLQPLGHGTQRIETLLSARYPAARVLRVDSDSTRRKQAWSAMREAIRSRTVDILVGTQMLAKGHDFPNLTLVGIVDPDTALFSADFRAGERLFAQLLQVSGRAGRAARSGQVLLQTRFPGHPVYQALARHDYEAFAAATLQERREAGFPPFVHQALLRAEGHALDPCLEFLGAAARCAAALSGGVTVYDPVPAAMPRLAGRARAQLLCQAPGREPLQAFLDAWYPRLAPLAGRKVRWALDVDPLEF